MSELFDALVADYRLRQARGMPQILAHLSPIRDYFGNWRAIDVTAESVDHYAETRLAEGKASATVNREIRLLSRAFRLALKNKHLSSLPEIRKLPENNRREGFFKNADFEAVVTNLPSYLQEFTLFGYFTGWRKGEIRSLAWVHVDMEGRAIRLRPQASKNGKGRVIGLEGELWDVIERQWKAREYERPDGTVAFSLHVFHNEDQPIGDFRKAWASACNKAGVQGKLFHDLRRTAVRDLIRIGVPEHTAMEISGHKTREIFMRYDIVDERDTRQAILKRQQYLESKTSRSHAAIAFPKKTAER